MLRILCHKEIDKQRWNAALDNSIIPLPYVYSWYLDIACPQWNAIVNEDYSVIAPLSYRIKAGIKYLYQPFFTQQFGLFFSHSDIINSAELSQEFYALLKSNSSFIQYQINHTNPFPSGFTKVHTRVTHLLLLNREYELIAKDFSENLKRNLKKHSSAAELRLSHSASNLIQLFKQTRADTVKELKQKDYQTLSQLVEQAARRKQGEVWEVWNGSKCLAASFILHNQFFAVNVFNASSIEGRTRQSMSVLLNHVIKYFSGNEIIFDFEGSDIPSVANYYKSYGAREQTYWHIYLNQLPWHLRIIKNIKDGL